MRVNCDVCGGEPAAVLCCADEAALCSACDLRVHRANKLAGKHRRVALLHPSYDSTTTGPLCDVCKERRGLVFCVEDRAILCADCDDPIHSANDLTAKHNRFLLVGAKLSNALVVDQAPSSPDCGDESDGVPAVCAQDSSTDRSSVLECSDNNGSGGGGAMISDYLTNICPGWRVDDLLFDDPTFSAAAKPGREEHVPSMDADLFDAVAGQPEKRGAWGPSSWTGDLGFEEVPTAMTDPTAARPAKQGRVRETYWNNIDNDSDVFSVPEITPPPAKKARPSSHWCF